MGGHINENGEFQSDKYPTTPPDKFPMSFGDPMAQDLLAIYAMRRRAVDSELSDDMELRLRQRGFAVPTCEMVEVVPGPEGQGSERPPCGKGRRRRTCCDVCFERLIASGEFTRDEAEREYPLLGAIVPGVRVSHKLVGARGRHLEGRVIRLLADVRVGDDTHTYKLENLELIPDGTPPAASVAPVCKTCNGHEQVWHIRWTAPDGGTGIMGRSAFLEWTGTEEEAHNGAEALNKTRAPTKFSAEQGKCPGCGKTNNPKGEPT